VLLPSTSGRSPPSGGAIRDRDVVDGAAASARRSGSDALEPSAAAAAGGGRRLLRSERMSPHRIRCASRVTVSIAHSELNGSRRAPSAVVASQVPSETFPGDASPRPTERSARGGAASAASTPPAWDLAEPAAPARRTGGQYRCARYRCRGLASRCCEADPGSCVARGPDAAREVRESSGPGDSSAGRGSARGEPSRVWRRRAAVATASGVEHGRDHGAG
jgi:hypothetical protein